MKPSKLINLGLAVGCRISVVVVLFGQVPIALSQTKDISLPPNIRQLLDDFELTPVECDGEVASIQITTETVCVQPTAAFQPGNYIYDAASDQIRPSETQDRSNSSSDASQYQFSFINILEYSQCLEDILQLYQNPTQFSQQERRSNCLADVFQNNIESGLSKEQALGLIQAADIYATSVLNPRLYPPAGIRRRITQTFEFSYTIDTSN